jgi:large subunit ribosomal protein L4e
MEAKILNKDGMQNGSVKLPAIFSESVRKDIIKRAFDTISANSRQPYGAKEGAGMRASAKLSRRRHDYRGSYGHGISRVPRKIMTRRGTRFNWVAAVAPGTVGGRRAHPPKAIKIFNQKINAKENRLAIRSAIAATIDKTLISERGHKIPAIYPFVIDDSFSKLTKTKEVLEALVKAGLGEELKRTEKRKIRSGKGKARGRKYISKKGLLFVLGKKSNFQKLCSNIQGVETMVVDKLNAKILAPGGVAGRLTIFSTGALDQLETKKLFTEERIKEKTIDKAEKPVKEKNTKKQVKVFTKSKETKKENGEGDIKNKVKTPAKNKK